MQYFGKKYVLTYRHNCEKIYNSAYNFERLTKLLSEIYLVVKNHNREEI